jgi:hypothetical protein
MKTRHYAYLAGLVDGDGSIAASKTFQQRSNCFQYDLKIEVTTSLRSTARRLIELFGGTHHKNVIDGEIYWKWVCQVRKNQRSVLEGMIPHLVVKRWQAERALDFVNLGHANVPEQRRVLVAEIQRLNQTLREDLDELPESEPKHSSAYIAGLLDSEGTVSIVAKNGSTAPYLAIYNDSVRLMEWLKKATNTDYKLHKLPNHLIWKFTGNNKERERFLLAVLPYMMTKREQAVLLLEYVRMFKQKDPQRRKVLYDKMWALNHFRTSETNTPDISANEMKIESGLVGDHESAPAVTQEDPKYLVDTDIWRRLENPRSERLSSDLSLTFKIHA